MAWGERGREGLIVETENTVGKGFMERCGSGWISFGQVSCIPIYPVGKLANWLLVSVIAYLQCNRCYVCIASGEYLYICQAN